MGATRIAAIAILWLTAPYYSRFPYGLNVAMEGGGIARHGESYILAGHMISATIASAFLALMFFRWKWKNEAGFGWLVVLTVSAFGIHLILSAISDFFVASYVPGLPVKGEGGRVTFYPPQTIPILGQLMSAGLYILTFPILVVILAAIRGLEFGISRVMHKNKKEAQQAAPSNR
jgi:hypothetical protein